MNQFECQIIAETAVRLPKGHDLELKQFPAAGRSVDVHIESAYRDAGFTSPLADYLSFDCTLEGSDLEDAIEASLLTVAVILPAIGFAANACYQDPAPLVAYDADPSKEKHALLFNHLFPTENLFAGSREIPASVILSVLEALIANEHGERLHRSMVYYNEALLAWRPGTELRAVESVFLVAETIKPVALSSYQAKTGLSDEALGREWKSIIKGIQCPNCKEQWTRRGDLEAAARLKLVFEGTADVHKLARGISDGLEHGFQNLPKLQKDAAKCRDDAARLVRACLTGLLGCDEQIAKILLTPPFDRPMRRDQVQCQTKMVLSGNAASLAPKGFRHPVIRVERKIKDVVLRQDGSSDVTAEVPMNFCFGDGVVAEDIKNGFGSRVSAVVIKDATLTGAAETPFGVERNKPQNKVRIVGLAQNLLIALWKYLWESK